MASRSAAEKHLQRQLRKTSENYELLAPGDRIMIAVSGGKDSYGLLHLMSELKDRLPFSIEIVAVHLDQKQPGYDGAPLRRYLESTGVPFEIIGEDTYSVVMERVEEGGTYCSLCSRLRRGILYRAAERLGCNKIALGHHRDDALETFLMNLIYSGKMQSMPPKYTTDDGRFEVIRPLIECEEEKLVTLSEEQAFPILPCNLCGSQDGLKRERMAKLLVHLEEERADVKSVMMNALSNISPTHLLDRDVQRAWAERNPEIPGKGTLGAGQIMGNDPKTPQPAFSREQGVPPHALGERGGSPLGPRRLPLISN